MPVAVVVVGNTGEGMASLRAIFLILLKAHGQVGKKRGGGEGEGEGESKEKKNRNKNKKEQRKGRFGLVV